MFKSGLISMVVLSAILAKADAHECKILRVGGSIGWLPVTYIDKETQKPSGIAYDLVRLIGAELDINIKIKSKLPWKRVLVDLESGEIDLGAAIYWTKEREQIYQFTDSYFVNEVRVFVLKGGEFTFNDFDDLIGKVGGIPSGGSFGDKFDSFAKVNGLKFEDVRSKDQRVGMLQLGRTDYFLQDHFDGMSYLRRNGLQEKIVALPNPVSREDVYFALSPNSPCVKLKSRINQIIQLAKRDGSIQNIIDKYTK